MEVSAVAASGIEAAFNITRRSDPPLDPHQRIDALRSQSALPYKVGGGAAWAVMRELLTAFGKLNPERMRCYSKRIVSKRRD
ncbi:hypothetical protein [Paraburkholderia caribensis]|uniref:hypothetical protein n=1 Tax=Paraburkholderia caribensis TaxID=75105 RepID=UPI00078E01B0|nr:hypothetical protein [Paraburkholderia caribensis]AMV47753.1 hypothetical protein ATN79_44615 [Paraburkholderia caribensis]